jgi:multicomponent Na+:H+ antiporter subunit D
VADPTHLPPLLVALPLLAAAIARIPRVHHAEWGPDVVALAAALGTLVAGAFTTRAARGGPLVHHVGGWEPRDGLVIGVPLVADVVAAGFVTLTAGLVLASFVYFTVAERRAGGLTHVLTLVLLAAFNGFVLAGDLFSMFVFIELLGITVYAVTAGKLEDPAALPASVNLAVTSTMGAVMFLSGVGILYGAIGTPSLVSAGGVLEGAELGASVAVALGLLAAGLAVKAGVVPFHFAHADVHTATTVPHAGLFGGVLLPVGLYGIARVLNVTFSGVLRPEDVRPVLVGVSVVTAVVGAVMCLVQQQLKRLLAFSSISHLGIAGVGLGLLTADGAAAAAVYVLGHGPVKLGLLLTAGAILYRLGGLRFDDLAGRVRDVRPALLLLGAGGLALAGLPPTGLFAGKAALSKAAGEVGLSGVVPLVYGSAILTGAAVVRAATQLWSSRPVPDDPLGHVAEHHPDEVPDHTPRVLYVVPAVLLSVGVAAPLVPGVLDAIAVAGAGFVDPGLYAAAVLEGERGPLPEADPMQVWEATSLVQGALAATVAGALGAGLVRWGGWWRAPVALPVRWLRRRHSGHVGDYTVWLVGGLAAWSAWAGLLVDR